ncbi:YciE/YciF ferroxidase family protein [Natrarchaeobius chitinivorans]|uniref:DUF892 family protein n=1 Tax=Natrarchaeobius chitinivorans TaxID=1679083 RepID=A0A3N6LVW2_NATCH|nr:DUF892 family protein [Natrarchaeobius chitinivorans]RQG94653.1 DUF892 family protein [Natrarchaeobius chitinivorans]
MNVETLEDLFEYQLRHAYYVERTHVELLEELAADASTANLRETLTNHRAETAEQIDRLEGIFAWIGRRPRASRSRTADGLAESWQLRTDGTDGTIVPDDLETALLAERLEIRAYESLLRIAGRLAYAPDVIEPLEETLAEERDALERLEALDSGWLFQGDPAGTERR